MTTIRSAALTVERRCAIRMLVEFGQDQVERLLDLPFGERVDAGGGFIQDEDGGILHQHAHQRHQLALSHREPRCRARPLRSAGRRAGSPAIRRRRSCGPSSSISASVAAGRGIADVLRHRAGEQERHLRDNAQLAAVLLQVEACGCPARRSVSLPGLELVEARDQLGDGGLARAGVPHQGQVLSRLDAQVEVRAGSAPCPCSGSARCSKQISPLSRGTAVMTGLHHVRVGIDQGEDAFGGRQARTGSAPRTPTGSGSGRRTGPGS